MKGVFSFVGDTVVNNQVVSLRMIGWFIMSIINQANYVSTPEFKKLIRSSYLMKYG